MKRPGRVLVVDDLERWRETLSEILEDAGYTVVTAARREEGEQQLRAGLFSLLILDLRLDDADQKNTEGMELLRKLNRLPGTEDLKVIIISAYGTRSQMREAFRDYKIVDFLSKEDFDDEEFLALVRSCCAPAEEAPRSLRVLVVEDDQRWREQLRETLEALGPGAHIQTAGTAKEAQQLVRDTPFDLVTVDLQLGADRPSSSRQGIQLMEIIRTSSPNPYGCAIVVLTAYPDTGSVRASYKDYAVEHVFPKEEFDDQGFIETCRSAIVNARIRQTELRDKQRNKLTFSFGLDQLHNSQWTGPNHSGTATAARPIKFDTGALIQSGDEISVQSSTHQASWRARARDAGAKLYQLLTREAAFQQHIASNHTSAVRGIPPQIQFVGPAPILGLPLELIRSGSTPFCQDHILSRKISGVAVSRKPEPFHLFVRQLIEHGQQLRILAIGSNIGNTVPSADREIELLSAQIGADLDMLGVRSHIQAIGGADATRICAEIQHGGYHMLHYAGHGSADPSQPELSALVLRHGSERYSLTAAVLQSLLRGTEMRMVFLNCCLSARTAARIGQGDFHGMLDALADADVPIIVGHRWSVPDDSARDLALQFYRALWRTFSPGEALLEARRHAARGLLGPDDDTWAAPVLVMQTS